MQIVSGDHRGRRRRGQRSDRRALCRGRRRWPTVLTGHPRLLAYELRALAEGPDADGEVRVRIAPPAAAAEPGRRASTSGRALDEHVAASIEAYIEALNRLLGEAHWAGATEAAGNRRGSSEAEAAGRADSADSDAGLDTTDWFDRSPRCSGAARLPGASPPIGRRGGPGRVRGRARRLRRGGGRRRSSRRRQPWRSRSASASRPSRTAWSRGRGPDRVLAVTARSARPTTCSSSSTCPSWARSRSRSAWPCWPCRASDRRHRARLLPPPGAGPGRRVPAPAGVARRGDVQHRGRGADNRRGEGSRRGGGRVRAGRGAVRAVGPAPRTSRPAMRTGRDSRCCRGRGTAVAAGWVAPSAPAAPLSLKSTIVFATPNVRGPLYRCLGVFARRGINMSQLESRPSRAARWEYVFWADLDLDAGLPRGR